MSTRADILTNLETRLKTIRRGSAYKTELKEVTILAASDHDLDKFNTPAIFIIDNDDNFLKDISGNRIEEIKLAVKGFITKESKLRETFENFLADVKKCLFGVEDPGELHANSQKVILGGTAITRGQCCMGFELEVTIRYYYSKASP